MKFPKKYAELIGKDGGVFTVPFSGKEFKVIASNGEGWEHVSVSLSDRCPRWREMCFIKTLFWDDEETVMQLHPKKSEYVNMHPYCLHLWKPIGQEIPTPDVLLV